MKPFSPSELATSDALEMCAATSVGSATPADRRRLFRLMECRLLHRAEWQYLGTRHADDVLSWPVDSYRCDRCERTWERAG